MAQANISIAEAAAGASNARNWMQKKNALAKNGKNETRDWMQMQNAGRTLGSGCSEDNCVEACEENWEKNGDHCYLWNTDAKNWTAAEDFCQQAGSHLASITSDSTNNFMLEGLNRRGLTQVSDQVWLGGNDIEEEGVWKWIDCTPWEYTFWYSGEPNNAGGPEACLEIRQFWNGKWNDESCGEERGFVCSKKICSEVTTEKVTTVGVTGVKGTGVEGTGESVMWKPASISLAATLFLFLLF